MANLGYFIVALQTIVAIHALTSYIVVYVQPPSDTNVTAVCLTNSTSFNVPVPRNFSRNGELTWKIPSSQPYDACWCRATMGNSILTKFSVYGDGMPRNSSEWLINSTGRRRISLESMPTNDYKAVWGSY